MASSETTTQLNPITVAEAARRLRLAPRTVVWMIEQGKLTEIARSDTGFRFVDASSVEALRLEREANPPRRGRPRKVISSDA